MCEKKRRILSIGAHPDDADTYSGGLLQKLQEAGWEIRLLSVTDGSAGTYRDELDRPKLAAMRREEAAASGRLLGGLYEVLDYPDGQLEVTLAARERLIRYIRAYAPDVIITNRPNDYHADHRNTALLIQDASFLLTVPHICPDVPALADVPAILFWNDDFKKPYPHQPDIIVPLKSAREDFKVRLACCHECQYFDWMYYPHHMEKIDWPREEQIAELAARFRRSSHREAESLREKLLAKYGDEGANVEYCESYEISEYGETPCEEFLVVAEALEY